MRVRFIVLALIFIITFLIPSLYFCGFFEYRIFNLALPTTTAGLGESMGLLNGLYSSIAVVVAVITVYFQSRELRDSTKAQSEQAKALKEQLHYQQKLSETQLHQAKALVDQFQQQKIANVIV